MEWDNIQKAIQSTYENAQRFLDDSKALQERGSIGHATSLAILGYEEAMKSYELTKFHPFFDEFYSKKERDYLRGVLRFHPSKQTSALLFRIGLEAMLSSETFTEEERKELGLPSKKELVEGTDFAFVEKLNDMKNNGFYVDAFQNPFWSPSAMNENSVVFTQKLLETQLESVGKVVKIVSQLDEFPKSTLERAKEEFNQLFSTLQQLTDDGVKETDQIDRRLSDFGVVGKIISALAKVSDNDKRLKAIKNEHDKKKT